VTGQDGRLVAVGPGVEPPAGGRTRLGSTVDSGADSTAGSTPDAWRAAALATLVGGLVIGDRASRGGVAGLAALAGSCAATAAAVRIAQASRRPPIMPRARPLEGLLPAPTFSVVVAARNEVRVLPGLIADLAAQDHRAPGGQPMFELILIDDRSTDGTAQTALRAAAAAGIGEVTHLVRRGGGDGLAGAALEGKGAALTAAQPSTYRGDVVVVLDADARIGPSFLRSLAGYVGAGERAITARRRILHAGTSALAGVQADEQTVDGELQRGRWALGGCSEFRGNGIVIQRELLERVGGWRADALTEDLDLSSRIAAAEGVRVAWAIDAEVWEEPVLSWSALWRQRVRWAEGAVRRVLEHGPTVLASGRLPPTARADFALYVGQLAAPPILIGALAGGLRRGRPGAGLALLGMYMGTGIGLAWDALRWETDESGARLAPAERGWRAIRAALFGGIWLAAVPSALWRVGTRRGRLRYEKMMHGEQPTARPARPTPSAGVRDAVGARPR
jgi:1,2-diacylglycerol 3-beta-glucosyltransferase